jgi:hypothetical protein
MRFLSYVQLPPINRSSLHPLGAKAEAKGNPGD